MMPDVLVFLEALESLAAQSKSREIDPARDESNPLCWKLLRLKADRNRTVQSGQR